MIQAPEALIRSIEKLYMDVTEPLDPYIGLSLTNLTAKLVETVYMMGYQDGKRSTSNSCEFCQSGECEGSAFPTSQIA